MKKVVILIVSIVGLVGLGLASYMFLRHNPNDPVGNFMRYPLAGGAMIVIGWVLWKLYRAYWAQFASVYELPWGERFKVIAQSDERGHVIATVAGLTRNPRTVWSKVTLPDVFKIEEGQIVQAKVGADWAEQDKV